MHVGLLYTPANVENKRDHSIDPHGSEQMNLTVKAIEKALVSNGHKVTRIEASIDLLRDIKDIEDLEVIYNTCTGITNKMQQANVVGMLEMTGIPFVGSSLSTHIFGLHKHISKRLFQSAEIPTANFQVFYTGEELVGPNLRYPLIIKPEHEGSSLGITEDSVVHDEVELRNGLHEVFRIFNQPALVEEFITGREFTVGVMGNDDPEILPIQEIIYDTKDGKGFMTVEIKAKDAIGVKCPADLDPEIASRIKDYAAKAYKALGCNEYARIDVRLDAEGIPYFLEINTLPGMQPDYSDFPRVAKGVLLMNNKINAKYGFIKPAVDAHTMGINSAAELLHNCGYDVVMADDLVAKAMNDYKHELRRKVVVEWIISNKIERLGISYRLDQDDSVNMIGFLIEEMKNAELMKFQGGAKSRQYFLAVCRKHVKKLTKNSMDL